jgi:hypothetical protein
MVQVSADDEPRIWITQGPSGVTEKQLLDALDELRARNSYVLSCGHVHDEGRQSGHVWCAACGRHVPMYPKPLT